jgi:hypothetical protein
MYGVNGDRDPVESTLDDPTGYDGARPVRIGNSAYNQRQNDVLGAVLDSVLLHSRRGLPGGCGRGRARPSAPRPGASPTRASGARGAPQLRVVEADDVVAMDRAADLARSGRSPLSKMGRDRRGDPPRHPHPRGHKRGVLRQHYDTDAPPTRWPACSTS